MTTPQLTARLRGGGCGVLVGALAVAAHGGAGGGVPRSADIALLLLVSLGAGIVAGGSRVRSGGAPLLRAGAVLLGGQWAGHFALSASLAHHDELFHLPSAPMVAAHTVAAFACAALILVAERLYLVASSVVRAVLTAPSTAIVQRAPRWRGLAFAGPGRPARGTRCPRAPPLSA